MRGYAALGDRVLVVEGTTSPTVRERLVDTEIQCLAADRRQPDRLFVGTVDDGLARSTDGGETFSECGEFTDRVTAVTVSPHDPGELWVGTEPSAVYRSNDGGDTWRRCGGLTELPSSERWSFPPRPHTHHVRWIALHPAKPERASVAIEAGAFVRTTDGGKSWEDHPAGARRDTHTIATHPERPDWVYVAAGDGYAESPDEGDSWETPQAGLDHRYVWGLAVDPGDPDRVVVSSASGARTAHTPSRAESYVYRRVGERWQLAMDGLPDPDGLTRAVLAAGREPGELFALTNRGLFRSDDGAISWDEIEIPWKESYEGTAARGLSVVE